MLLVSVTRQHESSQIYICLCLLSFPIISHPIPPFRLSHNTRFELPASYSKFPLAIYFTYDNVCFQATPNLSHLSFRQLVQKSVLCVSVTVQQIGSSGPTFPVQFNSVAQSCPTICNPMDCSMPGLPVHYQSLEFTQTCVH